MLTPTCTWKLDYDNTNLHEIGNQLHIVTQPPSASEWNGGRCNTCTAASAADSHFPANAIFPAKEMHISFSTASPITYIVWV